MTRLREALERARDGGAGPAAKAGGAAPEAQVPPTWQFDLEKEAPSEARLSSPPVDVEEADPPSPVADAVTEETEFQDNVANTSLAAKLVVRPDAEATLVEQFRRLAAALHHAQLQTGARTVMIASAVEKEGKTLTATNLSLTLSQSYQRRVLLVDADLRRPSIHRSFQLNNRRGLGDVLKQREMDGTLPVHKVSPTLWVMTAGQPDSDPMSGLVSDTMKQFLLDAAEQFDWVVLDTPPVALLTDANLLASMIDTALLVVNAKTTPYPLAMRAVEAIGASRVLGVVLNRAERSEVFAGYPYYSYSYSPRTTEKSDRRRRFRLAFTRKT